MGDKKVIFTFMFVIALLSFASAAPHSEYNAFSEKYFNVNGNTLTTSDKLVYTTGYYSINGGNWQSFTLNGDQYGNYPFLLDGGQANLPGALNNPGTHFVIVFSCSLENEAWNCHGDSPNEAKWQLEVIRNSGGNDDPAPNPNGGYCGDGTCDTTEYCSVCSADCGTCSEINCPCGPGEYCSTERYSNSPPVCLLEVPGETYFVDPNGNDNNPGTFNSPWATWKKGIGDNAVGAGDIVYFRGGTYFYPIVYDRSYRFTKSGSANNPIRYFNYPGERPVLDFSTLRQTGSVIGLVTNIDHSHFKGLEMQHLHQRQAGDEYAVLGWEINGRDVIIENSVVHDVEGKGFSPELVYDGYFINCDSYNMADPISSHPGERGAGFSGGNGDHANIDSSTSWHFIGCRAWSCSDQGFSSFSAGLVTYDSCWSMDNGMFIAGGHGFKLGWNNIGSDSVKRIMKNCVAVGNRHAGVNTNDGGYPTTGMQIHNNFMYRNGYGDKDFNSVGFHTHASGDTAARQRLRTFRNNIAYDDEDGPTDFNGAVTQDHNSWNLDVTLTDDDFISLDANQLYRPRKADGSLPDITFGKLREGSDLIGAGSDGNNLGPF